MIKFEIITIFPKIFDSYFSESIIKRAQKKGLVKINVHNLRDFTNDKHKKACLPKPWRRQVDERSFGGGPGMVMQIEPIYKAVQSVSAKRKTQNAKVILFSVKGKKFDQKCAERLSKYKDLTLICGHYEGVDERVAKYLADEEISMGDFVLSGGEIPAMLLVDAVSRLVPGFLGNKESIETKRWHKNKPEELPSYPVYTRPEIFYPKPKNKKIRWSVPKVLLSGNHKKIEEWRKKNLK